jgi:hypothetical protein
MRTGSEVDVYLVTGRRERGTVVTAAWKAHLNGDEPEFELRTLTIRSPGPDSWDYVIPSTAIAWVTYPTPQG